MKNAPKYILKNDVKIVLRAESLVIDKSNFCDQYAEIILSNPRYREDYGHNIQILDKKALAALEERMKQESTPSRDPEDIVIEVEVDGEETNEEEDLKNQEGESITGSEEVPSATPAEQEEGVGTSDEYNSKNAVTVIKGLESVEDVNAFVHAEEQRQTVLKAAEKRRSEFAEISD